MAIQDNQKSGVIRKIKKCLSLASSDNPNESAMAMRQAQSLMQKHDIEMAHVHASEISEHEAKTIYKGERPPNYIALLGEVIAGNFGAELLYIRAYGGLTKNGRPTNFRGRFQFVGPGSSATVSAYAFDVLMPKLKRARSGYIREWLAGMSKGEKTKLADLYSEGWVVAISDKLSSYKHSEEERRAFEAYKSQQEELQEYSPRYRGNRHTPDGQFSLAHGFSDGKHVSFHQGVGADHDKGAAHSRTLEHKEV